MAAPLNSPFTRRGLLRTAGVLALGGLGAALSATPAQAALGPGDPVLANDVRQEFLTAWTAYRRLTWGRDELKPVSGTGSEFFIGGTPLGLTIVESLDTLYLMELDGELTAAINWISGNLSFNRNASVHVFEIIIRMVGGLLSGYHATGRTVLLTQARDLADRLLPAFTKSPTGMPYSHVNLQTGAVSGNQVPLAEIGSNITEFGYLSQLTGDPKYLNAAKNALRAVYDRRSSFNLVGTTLNIETGAWTDTRAQIDPPVDSFFEYLWDARQFLGDTEIGGWYRTLTDAVLTRLAETTNGRLWFKQVDMNSGAVLSRSQSELSAFYAGLLAQGGNLSQGESYHSSWAAVMAKYPLPPESVDYPSLTATNTSYQLRPEYVDSALFLWMLTGNETYRSRGLDLWNKQKAGCKVANGYTIVDNFTTSPTTKGDLTPGYWYSENMKYFYLLWSASPRFDYTANYLTTEGDVLQGFNRVAAPSPSNTYRLVNRASGRLLDISGASVSDGGPAIVWDSNGGANQQWVVTTTSGYSRLTALHSGKVLEVPGSSTTNGTQLNQWSHNGTNTQQWSLTASGGYYVLTNRNSGKVLDAASTANGAAVVQQPASGATSQQWQLAQV